MRLTTRRYYIFSYRCASGAVGPVLTGPQTSVAVYSVIGGKNVKKVIHTRPVFLVLRSGRAYSAHRCIYLYIPARFEWRSCSRRRVDRDKHNYVIARCLTYNVI